MDGISSDVLGRICRGRIMTEEPITVYAKWELNTHHVIYYDEDKETVLE